MPRNRLGLCPTLLQIGLVEHRDRQTDIFLQSHRVVEITVSPVFLGFGPDYRDLGVVMPPPLRSVKKPHPGHNSLPAPIVIREKSTVAGLFNTGLPAFQLQFTSY